MTLPGSTGTRIERRPVIARCTARSPESKAARSGTYDDGIQHAHSGSSRSDSAIATSQAGSGTGPTASITARTESAWSHGMSVATTNTGPCAQASAVRMPPSGPPPGHRSGTRSRPMERATAGSPPTAATGTQPAAASVTAARCSIGAPSTTNAALSRPIRRLAPPASTAPASRRCCPCCGCCR